MRPRSVIIFSAAHYLFESSTPQQFDPARYRPPGREMRHQSGVVQKGLQAEIKSAARSRSYTAKFLIFFFSSSVVKTINDQCHRLRRFGVGSARGPKSCDVGYINSVVSDDFGGPAKAGTQNDVLKPAL